MKEFDEIVAIMHRLRAECPWDKEQSLDSLRTYLLEEAYECVEAIQEKPVKGNALLVEELGDVLLQVLFQSEILTEEMHEPVILRVIQTLKEKLIRRHPHIFSDSTVKRADAVLAQWNEIKRKEKEDRGEKVSQKSFLKGVAKGLPSLQLAQKLGERSKEALFDWSTPPEVWHQFLLEVDELKEAKTPQEKEHELGDILFCLAQWARHEKIDSEVALAAANSRFQYRFKTMERMAEEKHFDFKSLTAAEKEKLWVEAKKTEA